MNTHVHPGRCFKCGKDIEPAAVEPDEHDVWEMPTNAVHFSGGTNYGSRIYDALMDGVMVEVLICDDCLRAGRTLVRHVRYDQREAHHCQECKRCEHMAVLETRYGLEPLGDEQPDSATVPPDPLPENPNATLPAGANGYMHVEKKPCA